MEVGDIYSDLNLDDDVAVRDIDYFENGVETTCPEAIVRRGTNELGDQGRTMEVYYDNDEEVVTISIIDTYLGVVTDDDYVQDGDDGILVEVFEEGHTYFVKNGSYDLDTVLLVQVADDEIQEIIGEPETVTSDLTRVTASNNTVTAGGTEYPQAYCFTTGDDDVIDGVAATALDPDEDISYTLYLDQYGNYIAAVEYEDNSQSDLVYVNQVYDGTVLDGRQVRYSVLAEVVRMDGTVETLPIGDTASSTSGLTNDYDSMGGDFATLTYDEDDDKYDLDDTDLGDYTSEGIKAGVELSADDTYAKLGATNTTRNYYLDSSTTYLFVTLDGGDVDEVEVVVGGVNYTTGASAGVFAHDSRNVDYVVILDSYDANSDNVIFFGNVGDRGRENTGYVFRGYQIGNSDYTDYIIYSVDTDPTASETIVDGSDLGASSFTLNGFYSYRERSNGSLELEAITATALGSYNDSNEAWLTGVLDGDDDVDIRNGILTWESTPDNSALVSDAVVVDVTDADDSDENSYGRNVTSVSTMDRLLDNNTPYAFTVYMYINDDNEVEAIFITKIAGGPGIGGGDDEEVTDKKTVATVDGKPFTSLEAALEEAKDGDVVTLAKDATVSDPTTVNPGVTLDGDGHTITYTGSRVGSGPNSALVLSDGSSVKNVNLVGSGPMNVWSGKYGIQAYDAGEVTISDVTISNFNAAILVNGSTATLSGTVDVSGNYFGGIEVSKGSGIEDASELVVDGTVINTTESATAPTVWTECTDAAGSGAQGSVTGVRWSSYVVTKTSGSKTTYQIWWLMDSSIDPTAGN